MVVLTIVLVVWGIALQAPLEQPASSTVAPNPSKAPWYFLGLQEMLVYFDPWIAGVLLAEHDHRRLDRDSLHRHQQEWQRLLLVQRSQVCLHHVPVWVRGALGRADLAGHVPAGPNWNFFGPYEFWDLHKVIPLNNVQLSDMIWIQIMGTSKPANYFIREIAGILIVLGYFLITPYLMYGSSSRSMRRKRACFASSRWRS